MAFVMLSIWFYTRIVDKALVEPQSINASPACQKRIVEEPTKVAVPPAPAVATLLRTMELTRPFRTNGERSPMNFPEIKSAADVLK